MAALAAGLAAAATGACRQVDAVPPTTWQATAVTTPLASNLTDGCPASYEAGTDYFPDKAVVRHAGAFTVTYHGHYKVVEIAPHIGEGETTRFVLVQCGTPVPRDIDDSDEVKEQIAFADVILLNKTDLVAEADLARLEARIRAMNAAARVYRTRDAQVDMDAILNQGGFNLSRAMTVDPQYLEPEYPFEWGGIFALDAGTHALELEAGPDPAMGLVVLPVTGDTPAALDGAVMAAVLAYSDDEHAVGPGEVVTPGETMHTLDLSGGATVFRLQVPAPGFYAFFTEHHPDEFTMKTVAGGTAREPGTSRHFKPDHEHDEEVTSVGITTSGAVDVKKFNQWMGGLLQEQGQDLFRMKGILQLKDRDERYVFQGVHMLFDGRLDRPWGTETPRNSLIFIGRNLDRAALNAGFAGCLA